MGYRLLVSCKDDFIDNFCYRFVVSLHLISSHHIIIIIIIIIIITPRRGVHIVAYGEELSLAVQDSSIGDLATH